MENPIGRQIKSFTITQYVGRGGYGMVYRAVHNETGQDCALKMILPEHEANENLTLRFRREMQIIRELRHPHIINLVDAWQDGTTLWIAMEWAGGGDLRHYLKKHGSMAPERLSEILSQVASALDAAHELTIIHRDLKPDNILLGEDGTAYLTDFGIAKRKGYRSITTQGSIMGSPGYLSPEQIIGQDLTLQSDVCALGILIYEMLAGKHPFSDHQNQIKLMLALVQKKLPVLPGFNSEINAVIQRATLKKPEQRYPSASALAAHFAEAVKNQ